MRFEKDDDAIRVLAKKGVKVNTKVITVKDNQLGIDALGALDYLVNYHGYTVKLAKTA